MIHIFSIRTKLLGAFLLIAIFGVISAYLTITNQLNYSRNELLIVQNSRIIEALLEMKSVANEIDKEVVTFQLAEDSTTKKNELLANLENLDKWNNQYKQNVDANNTEDISFIIRLEEIRNTIVDVSLSYLSLKEQDIQGSALTLQRQLLETTIKELKLVIEDAIIQERSEVQAATDKTALLAKVNIQRNIALSSTAVSMALLFGFLLTRLIARPIKALHDGATKIAQGNLAQHIAIHTHDELGELAETFNSMSTKLKDSRVALEVQVHQTQEKANELIVKVDELRRMNKLMVNRELKMAELKQELKRFKKE
jgi:methyl-accepting chemotaxis protein